MSTANSIRVTGALASRPPLHLLAHGHHPSAVLASRLMVIGTPDAVRQAIVETRPDVERAQLVEQRETLWDLLRDLTAQKPEGYADRVQAINAALLPIVDRIRVLDAVLRARPAA